jgi:hypothetical protein
MLDAPKAAVDITHSAPIKVFIFTILPPFARFYSRLEDIMNAEMRVRSSRALAPLAAPVSALEFIPQFVNF